MIGDPPVDVGAENWMLALPSPAVARTLLGALGAVAVDVVGAAASARDPAHATAVMMTLQKAPTVMLLATARRTVCGRLRTAGPDDCTEGAVWG